MEQLRALAENSRALERRLAESEQRRAAVDEERGRLAAKCKKLRARLNRAATNQPTTSALLPPAVRSPSPHAPVVTRQPSAVDTNHQQQPSIINRLYDDVVKIVDAHLGSTSGVETSSSSVAVDELRDVKLVIDAFHEANCLLVDGSKCMKVSTRSWRRCATCSLLNMT